MRIRQKSFILSGMLFILLLGACAQHKSELSLRDSITGDAQAAIEVNWTQEGYVTTQGTSYSLQEIKVLLDMAEEIQTLTFSSCEVKSLDFLCWFPNLYAVSLVDCSLEPGVTLPQLTQLNAISLYQCGLTDLSIIENNPQITGLEANYNTISDIELLRGFHQLETLSLYGNKISSLDSLRELHALNRVGLLDGNYEIETLEPLMGLEHIQVISLPFPVYEKLPAEELNYFLNLSDEYDVVYWD